MDQNKIMYLLTRSPSKIDQLGSLMTNAYPIEPNARNGISIKTPPGFAPRETNAKPRVFLAETSGSRPKPSESMYDLSGHPAFEVPTEPLLSTSLLLEGTPTQNKTKPSHFVKWVTKFDGTGDP